MTPTTKDDQVAAPSPTVTGTFGSRQDRVVQIPTRPVIGIQVLPSGQRFLLDSFGPPKGRRFITIGSNPNCELTIEDDTVSSLHCAITRRRSRVFVHDLGSKNGVKVGGHPVASCELHDGTVFTIGRVTIAAIGQENLAQRVVIAASSMREFLLKAVELHGSKRAAAEAIGLAESTLRNWLNNKR